MLRRRLLGWVFAAALAVAATLTATAQPSYAGTPTQETGFGSNPGGLQMFRYAPAGLPAGAPLVVAMHGCTQSAGQFGDESGWLQLADRWRFALLLPQKPFGGCFGWYDSTQASRGWGEALSVKQMVDRMLTEYRGDARRVYATGLSAGGAMAAVMLATYPDVFAAGGVVAGIPFRCATYLAQSYGCMSPGLDRSAQSWGDLVRGASTYRGPWPRLSLWHGTNDLTVAPANMTELMEQWTNVNGADQTPDVSNTVGGYPHRVYTDGSGRAVVETYQIAGMSHGQPVAPTAEQCGRVGTYAHNVGVCAALHMGQFWGLQ
ncbi:extracellular catalytic domain type 1 short-chain-length polyhydroxyalkanoate depolymerase [Planosporangium mesophilum]|uniref:Feruloyl esterase n=1 Tax=Planosporangium mesophilum TaxID=689768 RepID=A0A8J3TFY6_9ACTN|nr:PHB depolymerase family esterase [Planosporangium mesophilum]NJC85115.1 PHB depolymerase family esterase [Planosporangium mesophilum]GII24432.1 feruloyl esterase [Planosporangium mesophilum]